MTSKLPKFRNSTFATVAGMRDLLRRGQILRVRDQEVREIRNRVTILTHPRERCLFLPHRGNNVFASLAETIWVLSGRDDVAWLKPYLPRAQQFSDDGQTWRAAYGPRLRNWNGVDQFVKVHDLLHAEAATRRAVMVLYDPDRDFVKSKDIPCNNWLHWLLRDGRLHLNVAVRSNDIVWGFSGVNAFEWSVLHEAMAFWVGAPVGDVTFFASSFHIYDHHYSRAEKAIAAFNGTTCYDFGLGSPTFCTPLDEFDKKINAWLAMENEARTSPCSLAMRDEFGDPFLNTAMQMCRLYHGLACEWNESRLRDELALLPASDFAAAAYEFCARTKPAILDEIPNESIAAFLKEFRKPCQEDRRRIIAGIKNLHQIKDQAYGPAWKRRGEVLSILANIARKVDRIEQYANFGAKLPDESIFDTVIDLFVYVTKYRLFLFENLESSNGVPLAASAPRPYSDYPVNFDALVDQIDVHPATQIDGTDLPRKIMNTFEQVQKLATSSNDSIARRSELAASLSTLAFSLIAKLSKEQPLLARSLDT